MQNLVDQVLIEGKATLDHAEQLSLIQTDDIEGQQTQDQNKEASPTLRYSWCWYVGHLPSLPPGTRIAADCAPGNKHPLATTGTTGRTPRRRPRSCRSQVYGSRWWQITWLG